MGSGELRGEVRLQRGIGDSGESSADDLLDAAGVEIDTGTESSHVGDLKEEGSSAYV